MFLVNLKIFLICGNHEYYGSDIEPTNQFIRGLLVVWPNITFLDNDYEDYCGYRFIGSVLWDQEATATSNDYKCIEGHTLTAGMRYIQIVDSIYNQ